MDSLTDFRAEFARNVREAHMIIADLREQVRLWHALVDASYKKVLETERFITTFGSMGPWDAE